MKVLVTGGAGFIGSHLSEKLAELGHKVTALDNLSITDKNMPHLEKAGVKFVKADITDYQKMLDETKGIDLVFHLAAMNRAIKSINDPLKANSVNITGTLNVLEACRKNGVKRFVFTSSSSVYGASKVFPRIECDKPQPILMESERLRRNITQMSISAFMESKPRFFDISASMGPGS